MREQFFDRYNAARMSEFAGKRITVMGLGRFGGGIAVTRWLAGQGAKILVTDKEPAEKLTDSLTQLKGLPIAYRLGEHRHEDFIPLAADLIVASPAVKLDDPCLQTARDAKVAITTEIRLFIERCPARRIIGITGTKGKSTTTAMLDAILSPHFKTWTGGNIGRSLLFDLPHIQPDDVVILELSSFMLAHLEPLRWSPHVAVITMLDADHLDWHGNLANYLHAKQNILRFQKPGDFAVIAEGSLHSQGFTRLTPAEIIRYALDNRAPLELPVPGLHNQLNAQAACVAAACLGITPDQSRAALQNHFRPLPHRLELVHESGGVRYFNDSIATIPDAAIAALESFLEKRVIQIVGGRLKDSSLSSLASALSRRAKAVLCVGETGGEIVHHIMNCLRPIPPVYLCEALPMAVRVAKALATEGDIVLLSTGCKSYDQFANYEHRGDAFRRLVLETGGS
jgi:UDP-N-acetylmuramoylalanine--D-glutamate ligase